MSNNLNITASPYCIGIDLGTSNSSAAVYLQGETVSLPLSGQVANPGGISMPSVVRFEDGKRDQLSVGKAAKDYTLIRPEEVFSSVKSVMRASDWTADPALVKKYQLEGQAVEPYEIAAEILRQLLEEVHSQDQVDLLGEVRSAVICVPANTTDVYRRAVRKAAHLAGIGARDENDEPILDSNGDPEGIYLLDEPTAAAIEYGRQLNFWSEQKDQTILVYDLGGGTFDVTVLSADSTNSPPTFSVLATKGVSRLGGDDFDRIIMDMCAEAFKNDSAIDIFDLASDQGGGVTQKELKEAQQKLKLASEQAKIAFAGGVVRHELNITAFLKDGAGTKHDLVVEVKKSDFVDRIQPLLSMANDCVKDALDAAKLDLGDLNRIVLVGGSTKADWVKDSILTLYPAGEERQPYVANDVDVIVARGAAFYGANALNRFDPTAVSEVDVENIVTHHLGVELESGVYGLVMPAGAPLTDDTPVQTALKRFGNPDMQSAIRISIWKTQRTILLEENDGETSTPERLFVSERDDLGQPLFECVEEVVLKGIPKAPKGTLPVDIRMEIDQNNLLKVTAECSGKEIEVETKVA